MEERGKACKGEKGKNRTRVGIKMGRNHCCQKALLTIAADIKTSLKICSNLSWLLVRVIAVSLKGCQDGDVGVNALTLLFRVTW